MSNNPNRTLLRRRTRPVVNFCLRTWTDEGDPEQATCTRIDDHKGHCCDEILRRTRGDRSRPCICRDRFNHNAEKGLPEDEEGDDQ